MSSSSEIASASGVRALAGELRMAAQFLALARLARAAEHDLRGPLNAIGLHLELLRDEVKAGVPADASAEETVAVLHREFQRFSALFEAFARRSRPSDDVRTTFDFRELLGEVHARLAALAKQRRVAVVVLTPPAPAQLFTGCRTQLEHALLFAALNGIDAMPDGGTLTLATAAAPDGVVRVQITDTGAGIAPEVLPKIWDLHFTTRAGAAGLGLPVARAIVEEHGGRAGIERTDARGTVLAFDFPASAAKA
jgi:signal transduction histidine kinase